jgi:hypothetical protein
MKLVFKGNLTGLLCDGGYAEPIAGNKVLLYLPFERDRVVENAVASTKDTFRLVSDKERAARENLLIATAETDAAGNFEFVLDEQYRSTAFDLDFICGTVPKAPPKPPKATPQFHLTTVYPEWRAAREHQDAVYYQWKYAIPSRWWCSIRVTYFDAWVIIGHLHVCDTKTPIPDVKVTAMDADFFTDDNLGSAVTDSTGFFRIDYTSADFKRTFLSPWINLETDPTFLSFMSGPDVYFTYEYNGVAIVGETAADRRNNVGHCLCVKLCLKDFKIPDVEVPASFTKIGLLGNHFINEVVASGSPNVIAAGTGKTPAGQAFYSCINLRGNLSKKLGGVAMEYSFDVVETAGPGGVQLGPWKKVMKEDMCEAEIGTFFVLTGDPDNPVAIIPYNVGITSGGVDPSGWIAVPQAANFAPNINGALISLNTARLNAATVNMAGLLQGQSTTTIAPLQQNRFFKIRMRKRQVGNPGSEVSAGVSNAVAMFNTVYQNVPKFGSWMPSVSSEMGVACIDIQEMIGGGGTDCVPITSQLHVNYTAANPNMGATSLTLYGPGGPYAITNVTPASNVPETFGTAQQLESGVIVVPVTDLKNCAYTVIFSVELKLTNGESQHGNIEDWMSFCKSS